MAKCFSVLFYFILRCTLVLGQNKEGAVFIKNSGTNYEKNKPNVDTSDFAKWQTVDEPLISDNGEYVCYQVKQNGISQRLILQDTGLTWRKDVSRVKSILFTHSSKYSIFLNCRDSLGIIHNGTDSCDYIFNVESFKVPSGNLDWVALRFANSSRDFSLINLYDGRRISKSNVSMYFFSKDGRYLILQTIDKERKALLLINIIAGTTKEIWGSSHDKEEIVDISMNNDGSRIAFLVKKVIGKEFLNFLFLYNTQDSAHGSSRIVSNGEIEAPLVIDRLNGFSNDNNRLFLTLKEKPNYAKNKQDRVQVDIWNYKDFKLQSQQLKEMYPKVFLGIIDISLNKIIRLQFENELIIHDPTYYENQNDEWIILVRSLGDASVTECNWNKGATRQVYLVSTTTGKRVLIKNWDSFEVYGDSFKLSPDGRFVVFYNAEEGSYFSYQIATGIFKNITMGLNVGWTLKEQENPTSKLDYRGIAGWSTDKQCVFLYDINDIWQIDLTGNSKPNNITNSFGIRNNIVFYLGVDYSEKFISKNQRVILTAFNKNNKENGFYSKDLGKANDPVKLTMGPYTYFIGDNIYMPNNARSQPIKAIDKNVYMLRRMSTEESPNYFITTDFMRFKAISNVYPERSYNWMKAELIKWKTFDGTYSQGILYKPEDFDSSRKYPVLFYYYEKSSNKLNCYIQPDFSDGDINIPWFINNGYLIFTPDIHYKIGKPGYSVYNSVVSAAYYLRKKPFVDDKRMGLCGHSFGAYETNYLITHTNMFSAALSSAGFADLISSYGSLWGAGYSWSDYFELRGVRIGSNPWENMNLYHTNSPILRADKVKTPLLMMNNKNDEAVSFSQGVQFFTALRRLGKRVWMLQYDEGGHSVSGKDAIDYTIRITQFFNHFLKGHDAPVWMVSGIPARLKSIDNGFQLVEESKEKN